jgi:hypothetical protein
MHKDHYESLFDIASVEKRPYRMFTRRCAIFVRSPPIPVRCLPSQPKWKLARPSSANMSSENNKEEYVGWIGLCLGLGCLLLPPLKKKPSSAKD